jgi:hypothetical protein
VQPPEILDFVAATAANLLEASVLTGNGAGENFAHGHGITPWKANRGSSFIGAVAIPDVVFQYNAIYEQLSRKIVNDPDLVAALNGR